MGLFEELKRRNVIRVGIAYAIAAWVLLQITDVVGEILELPAWGGKLILLILAVGFPLALIFAWAFEMTPQGIKREKDVDRSQSITQQTGRKLDRAIIGILTVAVAYLLVDKLVLQKPSEPPASPGTEQAATATKTAPAEEGPSVAVLPFVNMSSDPEQEYFSDGLTETLLHMLAQLPELRVAARTSSFAFKGQNKSVADIANTLGVAHILEGSVQKSGDRIRVTAQLIRAGDGFHVWSQNYTRPLEDIFAIQDEIATDVARALDTSLLGGEGESLHGVETANLTAYDLYLQAMEQQAIDSYSSLEIAENFFKQALSADPDFIDAKLGLVRNYFRMFGTGLIDQETRNRSVSPLLQQVRELQPDNRVAHAWTLALEIEEPGVFNDKQRREQITNDLRNLLPLMPTETFFRDGVAMYLANFNRQYEEALAVIEGGLLLDPLSADLYSSQGNVYLRMENLDKATHAFEKAAELEPNDPNHYAYLSNLAAQRGDLSGKFEWMRKAGEVDPQDHEIAAFIAEDLYGLRLPEEGDRWGRKVAALAPGSDVARRLELRRAIGREDWQEALRISRQMIEDEVGSRGGAYGFAVWVYSRLMMVNGRAQEAYQFLVSQAPAIEDFGTMPAENHEGNLQFNAIELLKAMGPRDKAVAAWEARIAAREAAGFPWRNSDYSVMYDALIHGDEDKAASTLLADMWNQPLATGIQRAGMLPTEIFKELLDRPDVAARKAELDAEFAMAQAEIRELMLTPEWNE